MIQEALSRAVDLLSDGPIDMNSSPRSPYWKRQVPVVLLMARNTNSTYSTPRDAGKSMEWEPRGSPFVEFSWEYESDTDLTCGRGCASLDDEGLRGRLYIHNGDDSSFVAAKQK